MNAVNLQFRKLDPAATLPSYQTPGSAGMDLAAFLPGGPITIPPGRIAIIPTALAVAIPPGHEGQVRPRSGLSTKHGVTVPNAPGTIDSDYRGELRVALINLGQAAFEVTHTMRIAQLVIAPVVQATIIEAAELSDTTRGSGGFGSTGAH